jgi:hypothetical protein
MTRRRLLLAAGATAVAVALVVVGVVGLRDDGDGGEPAKRAAPPPVQQFRSRPDLRPPPVTVLTRTAAAGPEALFLAPKRAVEQAGPMILDGRGELVWFRPLDTKGVADFRVQRYAGRPVLTWWRGRSEKGVGDGTYVIADDGYRQVATVSAGNGLTGDIHEFLITPRDTALITVYRRRPLDLSSVGGPKRGEVYEGVVQELDIATGRVLFQWNSLEHVRLAESYVDPPSASADGTAAPYDYFHVNSVSEDADGNLLVSARNTRAVYRIDRSTGRVLWRLGGRRSDFRLGPGVRFAWQHDARRQPDGTLTLFDNAAAPQVRPYSRALVLRLDESARRATLVRAYAHPRRLLAASQGNAQALPGGGILVGWGAQRYVTQFARDGRVVLDLRFGGEGADSYRAYRSSWSGRPARDPAAVLVTADDGSRTAYVSWNGATDVARWQVTAGRSADRQQPVSSAPHNGFETAVPIDTDAPWIRLRALDARGRVLGTSRALETAPADD